MKKAERPLTCPERCQPSKDGADITHTVSLTLFDRNGFSVIRAPYRWKHRHSLALLLWKSVFVATKAAEVFCHSHVGVIEKRLLLSRCHARENKLDFPPFVAVPDRS